MGIMQINEDQWMATCTDWWNWSTYNIYFFQWFKYEDEGYKQGKYILGESTDVSQ